jgi:NAD(P)-dependent dehydrogenase (short-subunit alcohol dehydrogenase family)
MTSFGFASTADEVLVDVDLSGKRAVVTGAASGIGVETPRALASVGAAGCWRCADPEAAERVAGPPRA